MPYHYSKTKQQLGVALKKIEEAIYTPIADLTATAWLTPEPVPFHDRKTGQKTQIPIGTSWGKLWDCAWFNFTGMVPMTALGHSVVLLIDLSGEGCVFDESGCPVLGLTTQSSTFDATLGRPGKRVVPFLDHATGGESVDLWVEAGNNDLFGVYKDNGVLKEAHIALFHQEFYDLYHDFRILHNLMQHLPQDGARYHRILRALHDAVQHLSAETPEEASKAREVLAPELGKIGGTPSLKVSAIGHAHMDLAWLWPIRETIRKGARTFATVLHMMEHYPDYVFGSSQPQLYQWMKDHYPDLYAKIKEKVAEGRWEPQGAMWVEPDTNVPSGESLIRQILYGKKFFKDEFGIEPRTCWLPDVFGYTGALPQLLEKSGVSYFMTQKLSWNIFNTFPHHTFLWKGIDGSQVLTHMPPENTYNSPALPESLLRIERNYADKVVSDESLMLFGIGDGGGGPGTDHLEALKREQNLESLPPVTQEYSEAFFDRIGQDRARYKTWVGELYMERHQGTYTTQARSKWYNRKLEVALRELELWAALYGHTYPREQLEKIWKEVLLYQFHDILPGSSITRVYDESLGRYQALLDMVNKFIAESDTALAEHADMTVSQRPVIVKNSLSWQRDEWVRFEKLWLKVSVPPIGYTTVDLAVAETGELATLNATRDRLESDIFVAQFADNGNLISLIDKENDREVLDGPGNMLAVYDDHGDAWDIEYNYRDRSPHYFELISETVGVDGPQAILHQHYEFGQSTLDQQIILTAGSRRIDFHTTVDWREDNKMLRTSFPVAVQTLEATCDIQFGTIKRPTHQNTSWDLARHEICAHKWIDLSQRDFGVALLNDCKYGYHIDGNLLDLNLLRSPSYPDPIADRGTHQFTYALYPHEGDHIVGRVAQAGYELNVPLQSIVPDKGGNGRLLGKSFMKVDSEGIVIETVKIAEDDNSLIVRLYESQGSNVEAALQFGFDVISVQVTDLMERHISELRVVDNHVELIFQPFEIMTLRVGRTPNSET